MSTHSAQTPGESLLVDTDVAHGVPLRDPGDALALDLLVRAGVELVGLTTVFGSAPMDAVQPVAERLGARWGLPVHRGAWGPGHDDTPAVELLAAHTGAVLALGPLTNVAAALRRGARWSHLVVRGGTRSLLPNRPPWLTVELNFSSDPEAAEQVLSRATAVLPDDACRDLWCTADDLARLPSWLAAGCMDWLTLGPLHSGRKAFRPRDVAAAQLMIELLDPTWVPSPFLLERRRVQLARSPGREGRLRYGAADVGAATRVVTALDPRAVRAAWFARCRV